MTPVLFTLMFTYMYGGAISGSTSEYLTFILPGILMMSVLFTTVYSGVALNTDLTKGVVDRFRSLPIWRPAPLVGAVVGDSVRYLVAGTVVIIVGTDPRLPPRRRMGRRPGGACADHRLLVRPRVGLHDARADHALAERSHEHRLHGALPAHLPLERVRAARDVAERASRRSSRSTRSRSW